MKKEPTSLKEKVYEGIMDLVVKGEIAPGSIINEKKIISIFNVSKSPVREAMIELCKDGVLTSIPRCGYQVTEISHKTVAEIVETRLILEITNFRNICAKVTNKLIDATFSEITKKQKIEKKTVWDAESNNSAFHTQLMALSGNQILLDFLKRLLNMYSRAYAQMYLAVPEVLSPSQNKIHDLFIEAWKERDYDKAENYLKKDIITSLEGIQSLNL